MNGITEKLLKKISRKFKYNLDYTGERVVPTEMHGDPTTWIQHLARYVFAVKLAVNKDVLDVACGTGYGTSILSSVAKKVVGVDISREAVSWAKRNNTFYCSCTFINKDIENKSILSEYDLIVSFETIEHLRDPKNFLRKISLNNLRENGELIFSVPLEDPPNRFHKQRYDWGSIVQLTEASLGRNITWYSQQYQNIELGKKRKARFAIGVWTKA